MNYINQSEITQQPGTKDTYNLGESCVDTSSQLETTNTTEIMNQDTKEPQGARIKNQGARRISAWLEAYEMTTKTRRVKIWLVKAIKEMSMKEQENLGFYFSKSGL